MGQTLEAGQESLVSVLFRCVTLEQPPHPQYPSLFQPHRVTVPNLQGRDSVWAHQGWGGSWWACTLYSSTSCVLCKTWGSVTSGLRCTCTLSVPATFCFVCSSSLRCYCFSICFQQRTHQVQLLYSLILKLFLTLAHIAYAHAAPWWGSLLWPSAVAQPAQVSTQNPASPPH